MAVFQWISPSPAQIAEAEAIAASIGETPYWQGNVLRVGQDEPPAAPPVPESVTMRQARIALLSLGLLDDVEAALASIPDEQQRKAALVTWEYSAAVERFNPLIVMLAPALGLTEAQVDDLFRLAATL